MFLFLGLVVFLNLAMPTRTDDKIPLLSVYPAPRTIYIKEINLKPSLKRRVESLIKHYDELTGEALFNRVGSSPIRISQAKIDQSKNEPGVMILALATVYFNKCNIVLDEKKWDEHSLQYVLLHELGHCYGYDHDLKPSRVMSGYYTTTLMEADEKEFLYELKTRATSLLLPQ